MSERGRENESDSLRQEYACVCVLKALICGEFPCNRIDYKSVDEKENDPPLGRQNEESDFSRRAPQQLLRSRRRRRQREENKLQR